MKSNARLTGATARQWALAASLIAGAALGVWMLGPAAHYRHI